MHTRALKPSQSVVPGMIVTAMMVGVSHAVDRAVDFVAKVRKPAPRQEPQFEEDELW